jgi:hypothetical protein
MGKDVRNVSRNGIMKEEDGRQFDLSQQLGSNNGTAGISSWCELTTGTKHCRRNRDGGGFFHFRLHIMKQASEQLTREDENGERRGTAVVESDRCDNDDGILLSNAMLCTRTYLPPSLSLSLPHHELAIQAQS